MPRRQHPSCGPYARALWSHPGHHGLVVSSTLPPTCEFFFLSSFSVRSPDFPSLGKSSRHKYTTSSSAFFFFPGVKFFHPHLLTLSLFRIFVFLASFLNFFHPPQECLIPSRMLEPRPPLLARTSTRVYRKQSAPTSRTRTHCHMWPPFPRLAKKTERGSNRSAQLTPERSSAG